MRVSRHRLPHRPPPTVVPPVKVGKLLCDTLVLAEGAGLLSFTVHERETIVAEQLSYTVMDGGAFTDGIGRKVSTANAQTSATHTIGVAHIRQATIFLTGGPK